MTESICYSCNYIEPVAVHYSPDGIESEQPLCAECAEQIGLL